ncbi:MAG TPA: hypothetical protein VM534_04065 [Thermoanaerobaculia bacterium]|nr:hypothetical protein [Thermoanaerobaculia bacterium]
MKTSGYILFSLLLLVFASPLSAQVNDTYVIPAVAWTPGDAGTLWASSLDVFNPQQYLLTVTLVFLPSHGTPGSVVFLDIPPNESFHTENVLPEWFARPLGSGGSLLLATFAEDNPGVPDTAAALAFLVSSRTYNNDSRGTFGQNIPGTWAYGLYDYEFDGLSAITAGVQNWGTPGINGFRTNVGAVNLGDWSVSLLLVVYDEFGRLVADDLEFRIPPMAHEQARLPVGVVNGTVEFFLDDDAPLDPDQLSLVFPYVSIADNKSGDAVYREPQLLANPDIFFKGSGVTGESATGIGGTLDKDRVRVALQKAARIGRVSRAIDGKPYLLPVD